jgi:hypothetical protein
MLRMRMKRLMTVTAILALAGCASVPPPVAKPVPPPTAHEKVEASEAIVEPRPVVANRSTPTESPQLQNPAVGGLDAREPETPEPETPKPAGETEVAVPGAKVVLIESSPSGATVVVNGVPVGKTPFSITVAATSRGFFRGETVVRVRFIAADARETSATVDEVFAPTDRIPSRVVYSPEGARRIW